MFPVIILFPTFVVMETKEQFLLAITELFMKYGIKSLTMDDISRHLGISKKNTLPICNRQKRFGKTMCRTNG